MPAPLLLVLAPVLALAGAALSFGLCRRAARHGWLPNAVTARSAHRVPVSRAGGAVVCGVASLIVAVWAGLTGWPVFAPLFALVLAGGGIGLLDDRREMGPRAKLALLSIIAGVAAWRLGPLPDPPGLVLPDGIGYALAAFWVLGFVNVFNFMDGLNGMAAGTGAVLLAALAVIGGAHAPLALLVVGPLLGFAVLNVARGAPFLGDAGSLSLGVLIAGGALAAEDGFWVIAAGAVPFIADAALTLAVRARRGADLLAAHDEHAYQRMAKRGVRHAGVAALYAALAAAGAGSVLLLGAGSVFVVAPLVALAWFASTRLALRQLDRRTEASARRSSA